MGFTINTTTIWNVVHRVGFFETQVLVAGLGPSRGTTARTQLGSQ